MDVKNVVANAGHFVSELYPEAKDVRLEEVSLEPNAIWHVVLSFRLLNTMGGLGTLLNDSTRLFKVIELDKETATPQALRVWKP